MKNIKLYFLIVLILISSCEGFLDERPSKGIIVPTTIDDLYSILANTQRINREINLGILLADDMFTNDQGYLTFINDFTRDAYKWKQEIFEVTGGNAFWNIPYITIFHANFILETVSEINPRNENDINDLRNLRGMALFHRANALTGLLQFFAPPVLTESDLQKRAIPIKLNSDVNDHQGLATIGEVYNRIFLDLEESMELLPETQSTVVHPGKLAVYGLLARIHLILGNYSEALNFSQKILDKKSDLLGYSEIFENTSFPIVGLQYPIPVLNNELIYFSSGGAFQSFTSPLSFVDRELVNSYSENDLRKFLFFNNPNQDGNVNFIGHYTGNFELFSGIALDEVYLIKSECLARLNRGKEGLDVLNSLLETRFRKGTYLPEEYLSETQSLSKILEERRKSLVFRGYLRWVDMRRLLKDPEWNGPKPRVVMGETFSIGTDPTRYFIIIPPNEFELNPAL